MLTYRIIEGFALETVGNWIFTVKGLLHPPDRWIAYLRYLPDPGGDRKRAGMPYRRVYRFDEQRHLLNARHPEYLVRDPVLGLDVQSVPRASVDVVYDPCAFLAHLRGSGPSDPLEDDALALAADLQRAADVPWHSLGVSGSLMLGMHRPDSDLDLLVYGEESSRAVHRALEALRQEAEGPIRWPTGEELQEIHAAHSPDTPLAFHDFARMQRRKVNEGRYQGRPFFLRFVKRPEECDEAYGERRSQVLGRATVRATVSDDGDAIFTPCSYGVGQVTILEGEQVDDLHEIVSFRGRFSDQARTGEWVEARGTLERVVYETGERYHRLAVGGQAGDWLLARPGVVGDGSSSSGPRQSV